MLTTKLTNCVECSTIPNLLSEIDCKLTELAKNSYSNIVFSLNLPIPETAILDLLHYKRILTYKFFNEDYTCNYTVKKIASKVKILTHK